MQVLSQTTSKISPSSSFPTAWGDELDALANAVDCPISTARMAEYLEWSHCHYCLAEQPQKFDSFKHLQRFAFADRTFWVWQCEDLLARKWHILIGKGRSPFESERKGRVWFHGARYEGSVDAHQILISEFPEYKNSNLKAH